MAERSPTVLAIRSFRKAGATPGDDMQMTAQQMLTIPSMFY